MWPSPFLFSCFQIHPENVFFLPSLPPPLLIATHPSIFHLSRAHSDTTKPGPVRSGRFALSSELLYHFRHLYVPECDFLS